jgi:hypothetical protein
VTLNQGARSKRTRLKARVHIYSDLPSTAFVCLSYALRDSVGEAGAHVVDH